MSIPSDIKTEWAAITDPLAKRFDRDVEVQLGQAKWELSDDIQSTQFWQACQLEGLDSRLGVPFHELRQPKKKENCLDIGCGVSFLIYPWGHWGAYFHGHELSPKTVQFIQSRGPQLNSKLFKEMTKGVAHNLSLYDDQQFQLAIATGMFYYYPPDYFTAVWSQLLRVMQPKSTLIMDIVDPESEWADEWGLLELEKGGEPEFSPLLDWEQTFKQHGIKMKKRAAGELFVTYALALPG
ncbi:MAG: class I SAM-dependent methyltransferase [Cyanobacteria bacterium P01_A01_bin.3]